MNAALWVLVLSLAFVADIAAVVAFSWWLRKPSTPSVVESRLRESFIVTLQTGESYRGVLWEADDRAWVLRNAHAIGAGQRGEDIAVDGEVVLLASAIAFAQRT